MLRDRPPSPSGIGVLPGVYPLPGPGVEFGALRMEEGAEPATLRCDEVSIMGSASLDELVGITREDCTALSMEERFHVDGTDGQRESFTILAPLPVLTCDVFDNWRIDVDGVEGELRIGSGSGGDACTIGDVWDKNRADP